MIHDCSSFFVFEPTRRICDVQPFSSDIGIVKDFPIVDEDLACDCTYTCEVWTLVLRNVLRVLPMEHNLILPLIMRSGGFLINHPPKIHFEDAIVHDHSV